MCKVGNSTCFHVLLWSSVNKESHDKFASHCCISIISHPNSGSYGFFFLGVELNGNCPPSYNYVHISPPKEARFVSPSQILLGIAADFLKV